MEISTTSVTSFSGLIREAVRAAEEGMIWFRGHSKKSYTLAPSALRASHSVSSLKSPLLKFRHLTEHLLEERPRDDLEWLFVAQHYGIPTTLLDWTEDPACALYFALCSMRSAFEVDKGGLRGLSPTVWCLNPRRLNAITDARMQYENDAGVLLYETRAIIFPKEGNLKEWTDTVFGDDHPARRNAFPVAILPTHSTPRIVAQRGMFTLHGNWPEPIESLTELRYPFGGAPCGIRRISIRNSKRILREMRSLQISRFRFFPEIHVAAENARHEFEEALRRMTY